MTLTEIDKNEIFEIINEHFGWVNSDCQKFSMLNENFKKYGLYELGFRYETGATKCCVFSEEFDYVVKFTWNSGDGFDWCKREYENYLAAVNEGLSWAFPYTDYLGSINGVNFYVQEMASPDEDDVYSICYNKVSDDYENRCSWREESYRSRGWSCERSDFISDEVDDLEDDDRVAFVMGYDPTLMDFLYNHRINDLHNGNFGYNGDHYVIIDFSGYGDFARALNNEEDK